MYKILYKLVILTCAICLTNGNQCIMEGVENWHLAVTVNIMDIDREVEIFRRTTENIEEITSVTQGEALNKGPYLTMSLMDSSFVISTNVAFNTYENDETSLTIGSVVQFRCTSGSISMLVITVHITDTNNHSPEFDPPIYEFTIAPPVPPGFLVTDCLNDVIARDVDLTTYRIDFELEGSDLFKITYDESSTEPKNFKAILKTATFIRTIPEPILLKVKATDVDLTGNDPRTVESTITIHANSEFEFPDEPIFSQAYYMATYTETNQLELQDSIYLRQGFDDQVTFSFDGDLKQYFQLVPIDNQVSFRVLSAIPIEEYPENGQIYLVVLAERLYTSGATATVIVQFPRAKELKFEELAYSGTLEDNTVNLPPIVLNVDADITVELKLNGDYSEYFSVQQISNQVHINVDSLPNSAILRNNYFMLTLSASADNIVAYTAIFLDIIKNDYVTPTFSKHIYYGTHIDGYNIDIEDIIVSQGLDETVTFEMDEDSCSDSSIRFTQDYYVGDYENGTITLDSITVIPYSDDIILELIGGNFTIVYAEDEVIKIRQKEGVQINLESKFLVLTLEARSLTSRAHTVIVLKIINDKQTNLSILNFSQAFYVVLFTESEGLIYNSEIVLSYGYDETVRFSLEGDNSEWFQVDESENPVVLKMSNSLPNEVVQNNNYLTFVIRASNGVNVSTRVTVIVEIITDDPSENKAAFDKVLYIGQFQENVVTHEAITILNHDGTPVLLSGTYSQLFEATIDSNGVVTVVWTLSEIIPDNASTIILEITAGVARAVLVIDVIPSGNSSENRAAFDKVLYIGQLQENVVTHEAITILHHDGSPVLLSGSYAQLFEANIDSNGVVTVAWISLEIIPAEVSCIALEMRASSASAVLVLSVTPSDHPSENRASFDKVLYIGQLQENVVTHETITILHHDGSPVLLSGSYAQLFEANIDLNGVVTVAWISLETIPAEISSIALEMRASSASAVLVLSVTPSDYPSESRVSFDKVLYIGQLQENVVTHETITILHHDGSPVILSGEYKQLFEASISNGLVTVTTISSVTIPEDITSIPLEMKSEEAIAVLILSIIHSEQSELPTVTFSSSAYTIRVDVSQNGVIGTIHATADNGEPITYTLLIENDHLRERLSVNSDGEISLSAPAASGRYNFQVQATAIVNRVSAVAQVSLWVEAVTVCDTDIVLHPLTVIERLEEEPHRDLLFLNQQQYAGCEYELINHWPRDQNWLYVDTEGLHARVIDREHESIAFMHVSQVQVELVLHCENDSSRHKRSLEHFSSYDYGSKSWILTNTIHFNSRRSLVNLIVIDINDNPPIFVGKENEPIYVGYPTNELEDTILPRSLVELKATDADIGENAEILYWSAEDNLAVAPTTGLVHVRQSALLEDNARFTVYATDQNGRGLNGSIDVVVKLLDENYIAVVTVSDAFLDDEGSIINDISTALGYDVRILNAAIVSTDTSTDTMTRKKRETGNTGAALQLYVYGIDENNTVHVNQLTSDIRNSDLIAVSIAKVLSLEDHLLQICPLPARETALLVATISLTVLLFLIITVITVREFLKRKTEQSNYEQFSDANSLSRNNSVQAIPIVESPERPRLNIGELRKSEKRLQDMLNEDRREPMYKKETELINESIIDMPIPLTPEPEQQKPIVIQSIDKLKDSNDDSDGDEFGEVKNNRRKSVVTFNENVEKIIHIEDRSASISSDSTDFEIYKF